MHSTVDVMSFLILHGNKVQAIESCVAMCKQEYGTLHSQTHTPMKASMPPANHAPFEDMSESVSASLNLPPVEVLSGKLDIRTKETKSLFQVAG